MDFEGKRGIEGMVPADVGPIDTLKPNSGSSDNQSMTGRNPKLEEWLGTGTAPEISPESIDLGTAIDMIAHRSGGSAHRHRSLAQRDTVRSELVHVKSVTLKELSEPPPHTPQRQTGEEASLHVEALWRLGATETGSGSVEPGPAYVYPGTGPAVDLTADSKPL
ncbi:unnamed protein product [Pleuronectes platessa]|uniref:Uncharacterized protein n=1 Tax=Pleuronectes platessa TaxID=8262 RepID=A0A9N7TXV8_PLEPL|nr:unnamed protein product [Pleuronectes platessa]